MRFRILPTGLVDFQEDVSDEPRMSPEQRMCIEHVLRNTAMGIEGAISLVDKEAARITTSSLAAVLRGLSKNLARCVDYLDAGTFCPISSDECSYVNRFVGCSRVNTCQLQREKISGA